MGNDINTANARNLAPRPMHSLQSSTVIKPPRPALSQLTNFADYSRSHQRSLSTTKSKSKSKRKLSFRRSKSRSSAPAATLDSVPSGVPTLQYGPSNSNPSISTTYRNRSVYTQITSTADVDKISNGITGTHINARVVKIAAQFWTQYIDNKTMQEKLELSCSIFFEMMAHNAEMKNILKQSMISQQSIETSSLKFLDMMGWLLRSLIRSDVDVATSLAQLGAMHRKMGITIDHFDPMLKSMHSTFSYYFPFKYSIQIKYAIDQIFTLAARIMSGQNLNEALNGRHLSELNDEMNDGAFLTSLSVCLESNIGREYLYRYLQQTFCDEIAIFLQSMRKFHQQTSDKERFMVARDVVKSCVENEARISVPLSAANFCDEIAIFLQSMRKFHQQTSDKERFMVARDVVKSCVENEATFTVNISYELRQQTLGKMKQLERMFFEKDELTVPKDLFVGVEAEMYKLISENHWRKFSNTFKHMDNVHGQ
eukprot:CAMPEP_0202727548 /NCGR_PEP_ID=MMETSP1385-20130828/185178_1 /ASSEMBLY_ACC=CAM_ASM_000861 /TAXON_ID=933848 /ORGANISM="Elphidium margaritaceum" /LENGTH=482 /DNA_ID=CAMNT_0049393791 /DNA_START=44 /DNA_END=1493 /DNA_ORIENTATION=+